MSENIKPCPFCGGEAHDYPIEPHKHSFSGMPDHPGSHVIECYACEAGKIGATRDYVTALWNMRDQSAIEAARQERAKLKFDLEHTAELLAISERDNADLRRQLAAAQALVCMYRDALVDGPENLSNSLAEELATHADNSALDTLLAAKERETIERCKKVCDKRAERWALHGKEAAAEAHEAKMCAAAIGAMLQKEPS